MDLTLRNLRACPRWDTVDGFSILAAHSDPWWIFDIPIFRSHPERILIFYKSSSGNSIVWSRLRTSILKAGWGAKKMYMQACQLFCCPVLLPLESFCLMPLSCHCWSWGWLQSQGTTLVHLAEGAGTRGCSFALMVFKPYNKVLCCQLMGVRVFSGALELRTLLFSSWRSDPWFSYLKYHLPCPPALCSHIHQLTAPTPSFGKLLWCIPHIWAVHTG